MIAMVKTNNSIYETEIFAVIHDGLRSQIIGFNEEQSNIILVDMYKTNIQGFIDRHVFIIDTTINKDAWTDSEKLSGYSWLVNNEGLVEKIRDNQPLDSLVLGQFQDVQAKLKTKEYFHLRNKQDIENLKSAALDFHDAYVKKIDRLEAEYRILFDTTWGCSIEFTLKDNPMIKLEENYGKYGEIFGSSIFIEDDFVYWVDAESIASSDHIEEDYRYFKAKNIIWRIIVDL